MPADYAGTLVGGKIGVAWVLRECPVNKLESLRQTLVPLLVSLYRLEVRTILRVLGRLRVGFVPVGFDELTNLTHLSLHLHLTGFIPLSPSSPGLIQCLGPLFEQVPNLLSVGHNIVGEVAKDGYSRGSSLDQRHIDQLQDVVGGN